MVLIIPHLEGGPDDIAVPIVFYNAVVDRELLPLDPTPNGVISRAITAHLEVNVVINVSEMYHHTHRGNGDEGGDGPGEDQAQGQQGCHRSCHVTVLMGYSLLVTSGPSSGDNLRVCVSCSPWGRLPPLSWSWFSPWLPPP